IPVERLVEFCRELPYLLHIQFPPWQKNVDIWIMLSISMSYIFCHVQRSAMTKSKTPFGQSSKNATPPKPKSKTIFAS
ncbi:MAG: hypothetical protein U1D70_17125, partial [Methylobacter sp.]|nr:hypothetical protein [Methylobacter sp.]MDP2429109.1 hypothetical protein [Methylobacter sp.]MDP3055584.1 hypothetical protein [Methylobacter sp.]MDP3364301.1 hypothetical protein [Methylobacter sp.]MDZ4220729.1 hypothetical protein [Methylobacter sp.]